MGCIFNKRQAVNTTQTEKTSGNSRVCAAKRYLARLTSLSFMHEGSLTASDSNICGQKRNFAPLTREHV